MKATIAKKIAILKVLCGNGHMTRMELFNQCDKSIFNEAGWSVFKRVLGMLISDGMITIVHPKFANHIATTYTLSEKGRKEC